jgi:hypothetical protein
MCSALGPLRLALMWSQRHARGALQCHEGASPCQGYLSSSGPKHGHGTLLDAAAASSASSLPSPSHTTTTTAVLLLPKPPLRPPRRRDPAAGQLAGSCFGFSITHKTWLCAPLHRLTCCGATRTLPAHPVWELQYVCKLPDCFRFPRTNPVVVRYPNARTSSCHQAGSLRCVVVGLSGSSAPGTSYTLVSQAERKETGETPSDTTN